MRFLTVCLLNIIFSFLPWDLLLIKLYGRKNPPSALQAHLVHLPTSMAADQQRHLLKKHT